MSDLGWIGVWLLIVSALVILIEMVLAGLWVLRIARTARELSRRLATERGRLESDLGALRLALAETEMLWRPYGRLLRWLRHPLVVAVLQSYARRGAMR
ncbi:MAG TPA: hypothetical protein VGG31_09290 [Candidatus Dormibacteraeota bacterium]